MKARCKPTAVAPPRRSTSSRSSSSCSAASKTRPAMTYSSIRHFSSENRNQNVSSAITKNTNTNKQTPNQTPSNFLSSGKALFSLKNWKSARNFPLSLLPSRFMTEITPRPSDKPSILVEDSKTRKSLEQHVVRSASNLEDLDLDDPKQRRLMEKQIEWETKFEQLIAADYIDPDLEPRERRSRRTAAAFEEQLIPRQTLDYNAKWCRHQTVVPLDSVIFPEEGDNLTNGDFAPRIARRIYIAPHATVCGNVELRDESSVWYGVVIRGDNRLVRVGAYTNIQDGTIIHEARKPLNIDHDGSTILGHFVTIGHNCILKACTIEHMCFVGMGSVLEEGSYMETESMLGAYSILPKGARVPKGELWMGRPAKFVRKLEEKDIKEIKLNALKYAVYGREHLEQYFCDATQWREKEKLKLPSDHMRPDRMSDY